MTSGPARRAIWLLAVGQTIGYGSLYYIYPALLTAWEADLGWTKGDLATGPTLAIVIAALGALPMGRLVDRGHGGLLLAGGAALGGLAVAALSQVATLAQYVAVWAVIGLAQAASLYEVCFSFLTLASRGPARAAITRITLVAGFASTLAFPAGALMAAEWGWRGAVLGFAAAQLLITLPLNIWATRAFPKAVRDGPEAAAVPKAAYRAALRRPAFWLIAATFGCAALNHAMLLTYAIPVFTELGVPAAAAVAAASVFGPSQVAGRVFLLLSERRVGAGPALLAAMGVLVLASGLLLAAGLAPLLVFAFAVMQGAAMGMLSILKPVLTAEVLGTGAFGAVAGTLYTAALLATAAAPGIGAALLAAGGTAALMAATLALSLAALAAAAGVGRAAHVHAG